MSSSSMRSRLFPTSLASLTYLNWPRTSEGCWLAAVRARKVPHQISLRFEQDGANQPVKSRRRGSKLNDRAFGNCTETNVIVLISQCDRDVRVLLQVDERNSHAHRVSVKNSQHTF